ncbi:HesA/MoeB/ThiF family protein [Pedobacter sp. SYP-B3415]|uniref:HesA/MoeB/ThiF family protein n=1 Tax=Pedobacter sp. SYP-B3415 TaxID=2496641 RepID=UPI00101BAF6F|nr:HesA/MoeB/ThiF family protein [Pedobacter sp. SYP-B3415]
MELTAEDYQRYNRQIRMEGFGAEAQLSLKKGSVLVVGAGGLGCPALLYLASAGVGRIGIADNDVITLSNLQRQILFDTADIGKAKATVAAEKLRLKNPHTAMEVINARVTAQNVLEIVSRYDVVIDGTDNFEAAYLLNDACVITGRPLVYGSLFQYEGQLSTFNYQGGPTLRCLFPEPPDDAENCSIAGVLGVLPGLIGTWQATEAIKILSGTGKPLSGELLVLNALGNQIDRMRFAAVPENKVIKQLKPYGQPAAGVDIDSTTFRQKLENENVQVVDVREPSEFAAFNIGGKNIPVTNLEKRIDEIDPRIETVVVCHSGIRSKKAMAVILDHFPQINIKNLKYGLQTY